MNWRLAALAVTTVAVSLYAAAIDVERPSIAADLPQEASSWMITPAVLPATTVLPPPSTTVTVLAASAPVGSHASSRSSTKAPARPASVRVSSPGPTNGTPGNCESYKATALRAGWTAAQWPKLRYIMGERGPGHRGESGCIPTATHNNSNGTQDRGLMQINSVHWGWLRVAGISPAMLYDPYWNLKAAHLLYLRAHGWSPWNA